MSVALVLALRCPQCSPSIATFRRPYSEGAQVTHTLGRISCPSAECPSHSTAPRYDFLCHSRSPTSVGRPAPAILLGTGTSPTRLNEPQNQTLMLTQCMAAHIHTSHHPRHLLLASLLPGGQTSREKEREPTTNLFAPLLFLLLPSICKLTCASPV